MAASTVARLSSLGDTTGLPGLSIDGDGLYGLSWPQGRPEEVTLTVALFEDLLAELNMGRRAINVLGVIARALTGLVPSAPDNVTGVPTQPVDDTP